VFWQATEHAAFWQESARTPSRPLRGPIFLPRWRPEQHLLFAAVRHSMTPENRARLLSCPGLTPTTSFATDPPSEISIMVPMRCILPRWLFAFAGCLLVTGTELRADESIPFSRVAPLFQQHCHSCHGPKQAKGKLRIDTLNPDFVKGDGDRWRDVLDRLNFGDMPPDK